MPCFKSMGEHRCGRRIEAHKLSQSEIDDAFEPLLGVALRAGCLLKACATGRHRHHHVRSAAPAGRVPRVQVVVRVARRPGSRLVACTTRRLHIRAASACLDLGASTVRTRVPSSPFHSIRGTLACSMAHSFMQLFLLAHVAAHFFQWIFLDFQWNSHRRSFFDRIFVFFAKKFKNGVRFGCDESLRAGGRAAPPVPGCESLQIPQNYTIPLVSIGFSL